MQFICEVSDKYQYLMCWLSKGNATYHVGVTLLTLRLACVALHALHLSKILKFGHDIHLPSYSVCACVLAYACVCLKLEQECADVHRVV